MLGTVALGQKSITAHHRQAAAPAASPFLARKEGMAAIEGEVAEAGRIGPVHAGDTGQRIINSQWRLLGQEKGREPEPAAEREVTCTNRSSEHLEDRDTNRSTRPYRQHRHSIIGVRVHRSAPGVLRATCRAGLPEEEGQERDTEHHRRHNRRYGVIRPVRGRLRGLTLAVLLHEARMHG